jgi:hypothetical protein
MPRIDCRPDLVFPEVLEARLLAPGSAPDFAPRELGVVPLAWDWLGWSRYAVPLPRGNCHLHFNLTCHGDGPDGLGLHASFYGQQLVSDFLRPIQESLDPLRLEFAIDVPGQ